MFETDFPHPTCLYPEPLVTAAQALEGASEALKRKVMGGNAVKLYNLPL
jgi:predicted TIM-barrel fold metal-dependent hydrolase